MNVDHASAAHVVLSITPPTDVTAVAFVHELVSIASPSGREQEAAGFFASAATRWGFASSIDEAGNAIATRSSNPRGNSSATKHLVLLGHIDTVPGAIPPRIEGDVLHGRGSVDAKGPLAAMLIAASRAALPDCMCVHVVAAVGEETPTSPGARYFSTRLRADACIIGEPSHADGVTLGYKGRLVMTVHVRHESGHSAGPAGSPADAALTFWNACTTRIQTLNTGRVGAFECIQLTVQAIRSNSDGLHAECALTAGFRLPRWIGPLELQKLLEEVAATHPGVTLEFSGRESAFATDRNDLVVRALSSAIRAHGHRPHPKFKTGTSDMNVVAPIWQCPIAAYGPGDSALDHSPHERLELSEYLQSIRVLVSAIEYIGAEWATLNASPS